MRDKKLLALVESAIMIALATVLSIFKIIDLPYGGSVTIASMLPVAIIAYRHGLGWGIGSGFVYGVLQQLLGLNKLSWVTGWQSIVAVVLLDYIIAFTVIGFAGVFRKSISNQAVGLSMGCLLTCILRYACHVVSGATVWAGLSIPTQDALIYSFIYNATYMLPEAIVLIAAAMYIGSTIDLRAAVPTRMYQKSEDKNTAWMLPVAGLSVVAAVVYDVVAIFAHLQDAETGEFTITNIAEVDWTSVIVVTAIGIIMAVALACARNFSRKQKA